MVLHNPNNWHWVDKNCVPWTKEYFSKKLVISAAKDTATVEVSKVLTVDGDSDVCQRKGKVIGLYDLSVELEFIGKSGETDVKGKIKIPEVMYNTEEDEFVFDISIENESAETNAVRTLLKSNIVPKLRSALVQYGVDLIKENGETIQHPDSDKSSATSFKSFERESTKSTITNTSQVRLSPTFTASAEQLYDVFTDPKLIAAWSRGAPEMSGAAAVGTKFKIFGGNVQGEFTKLEKPTVIEQKWRLRDWKEGHFSTVRFNLTQDVGITTLNVSWNGIPVGQEDVVKSNFTNYYVHPIMLTFGFGVPS